MVFFFNDTATTEIYTLSLHDALPISNGPGLRTPAPCRLRRPDATAGPSFTRVTRTTCSGRCAVPVNKPVDSTRSEEHTSELQSHLNLVCRLLLAKKKGALGRLAVVAG